MLKNNLNKGYTLPVFAAASATAALLKLQGKNDIISVTLDLINPSETVNIEIEQVAKINDNVALAITRSDPGDNLDLTRHTPIWAMVEISNTKQDDCQNKIIIQGGEGIGFNTKNNQAAIYSYAKQIITHNLEQLLSENERVIVTIILPEGKKLAVRTSNSAFGVIEGLSLLGIGGISQPLSSPQQLELFQNELIEKSKKYDSLVFCIGENGLDLAEKIGINSEQLVKTANWIGPMLVTAAVNNVKSILLFGYHGKLLKLAGGIFHTHHHLADGRLEILTAICASLGLENYLLQQVFNCSTAEDALILLRHHNAVENVYEAIASRIDQRSQEYIFNHSQLKITVGSVLFDRQRKIITTSKNGQKLLPFLCYDSLNI
jgi:cobalt-precorrin-5B (C1)-methyltransferase